MEQNIEQIIQQIDDLFRNFNRDGHKFTVDYDEDKDGLYCHYTPYVNDVGYSVSDYLLYVCDTASKDLQTLKEYLEKNNIGSRIGCEWCAEWGWSKE